MSLYYGNKLVIIKIKCCPGKLRKKKVVSTHLTNPQTLPSPPTRHHSMTGAGPTMSHARSRRRVHPPTPSSVLYINLPPTLCFVEKLPTYHSLHPSLQWLSFWFLSQSQPSSSLTSSTSASDSSSPRAHTPGPSSETSTTSSRWGSGALRSGHRPMAPSYRCGSGQPWTS